MIPKHKNPTQPDRTATAPYNFVPLPEVVLPAVKSAAELPGHDRYLNGKYKHTGYFEVSLTTKSPVYVRCGLTPSEYVKSEEQRKSSSEGANFRGAIRNKPDFFYTRTPGEPLIPGSSLRGMLRQIVEILSYSKVPQVSHKQLVYRAVGDQTALGDHYRRQMLGPDKSGTPGELHFDYCSPNIKGGYLEAVGDSWAIRPAQEHLGESIVRVWYSDAHSVTGGFGRWLTHDVFIRPVSRTASKRGVRGGHELILDVALTDTCQATAGAGLKRAKLIESGHMGGRVEKHWHCAIYEPDSTKPLVPIPDEMWSVYVEDRDTTRDRNRKTLPIRRAGDPLFYLLDSHGQLVFFGSTAMFRLVYENRPIDLIPASLRDPSIVDFTEAMFGYVRSDEELKQVDPRPKQGEKGHSYAGRIFVTDAQLDPHQSDVWLTADTPDGVLEPHILASPKPTTFQHYLTQHAPDDVSELDFYDRPKTTIRGTKMYWSKGNVSADQLTAKHPDEDPSVPSQARGQFYLDRSTNRYRVKDSSKQHTRMRPVASGKSFTFRVYFENLSDVELGLIEWALSLPGAADAGYCHRLGMGKPLGMGAVMLRRPRLHLYNTAERYVGLLTDDSAWNLGVDENAPVKPYYEIFEEHVVSNLPHEASAARFAEIERIRMLLAILEWRDPDPLAVKKQYMTDLNAFRKRRVLPDPLGVGRTSQSRGHGSTGTGGRDRRDQGKPPRRSDRDTPPQKPSHGPSAGKPRPQKEITERKSTDQTRSLAEEFMEQLKRKQGGENPEK